MYVGLVRCLAGNWWLTLSNTNLKENRVFLYKFSAPDTGGGTQEHETSFSGRAFATSSLQANFLISAPLERNGRCLHVPVTSSFQANFLISAPLERSGRCLHVPVTSSLQANFLISAPLERNGRCLHVPGTSSLQVNFLITGHLERLGRR